MHGNYYTGLIKKQLAAHGFKIPCIIMAWYRLPQCDLKLTLVISGPLNLEGWCLLDHSPKRNLLQKEVHSQRADQVLS